jgi:hypothetical protein
MRLFATLALAIVAGLIIFALPAIAADAGLVPGTPPIESATVDELVGALLGAAKAIVTAVGAILLASLAVVGLMLPLAIKTKISQWAAGARALRGDLVDKTLDVALEAGLSPAQAATAVIDQLPGTVRDGRFTPRQIEDRAKLRRQRKAPVG